MAVTPMELVTIVGPLERFDEIVRSSIVNRDFHVENAVKIIDRVNFLHPFSVENPYTMLLQKLEAFAFTYGFDFDYRDFGEEGFTTKQVESYLSTLENTFSGLVEERDKLNLIVSDNEQIARQLEHVRGLDVNLQDFFNFTYAKFRFGRLRRETYDSMARLLEEKNNFFFFPTSIERDYVYAMYMLPRVAEDDIDSLFASLHFERIRIADKVSGTADEAMARLQEESAQVRAQAEKNEAEIARLRRQEKENFYLHYSFLKYMNDSYELRQYAAHTEESFYLLGWVPVPSLSSFTDNLDRQDGITYVVEKAPAKDFSPPVLLKNNKISAVFQPYLSMYGLPLDNEIDPTFLMSLSYSFLFGMMFGDVGQGLVAIALGFAFWKFKGMWLGKIIMAAGAFATLFGFVYGSVFGFENVLPYHGFKVMEGGNTNTMLLLSVLIGAVLIIVSMTLNIINGFRQRDYTKMLFSPNGLAGLVLYSAIIGAVLPLLGVVDFTVSAVYVLFLIVLPLFCIFMRGPLGKLAERRPDWKPASFGNYMVESIFELVEIMLSYVTNTISFLRVGAFALSHAGMMMVVFSLAESGGGLNPIVIIFGNIIVMGIEGLLVGIQVLRLEFYEVFGRFYSGGGVAYKPITIEYKTIKN